MISAKSILLKKLQNFFHSKKNHHVASELPENIKQQISMPLPLEQLTGTYPNKPTSYEYSENLTVLGIKVNQASSITDTTRQLGPFPPPSYLQLEILKHFKIKNRSKLTRTQANNLIKILFSDPANIEQWKRRPATSKLKQGILFMGGQLNASMTYNEAQSRLRHYGKEHPRKFSEWKYIEALFLLVNCRDSLEHHNARKLTWKCFFEAYDDIKHSGVGYISINADRIHEHAKQAAFAQQYPRDSIKILGPVNTNLIDTAGTIFSSSKAE
jgi:hypothetical protein